MQERVIAMTYITREDGITALSLSNRAANCLRREGLHTVGDVLDYAQKHNWLDLHSVGQKTADELTATVRELQSHEGEYRLVERAAIPEVTEATNASAQQLWEDVPVEKLPLSVRAQNCLAHEGIRYASQLLDMTLDDLMRIKNMGRKTAEEILERVKKLPTDRLIAATPDNMQLPAEDAKYCVELAKEMTACYGRTESAWLREILEAKETYPPAQSETFFYRLYERHTVSDAVKAAILRQVESKGNEIMRTALAEKCPAHLRNTAILEELLRALEADGRITVGEDVIRRRYPTVREYANSLPDGRNKEMLLCRLEGKTLDEVGKCFDGITRERVRQIINKALEKRPWLHEDQYRYVYDTYAFSPEDFSLAFGEPPSAYIYLETISMTKQKNRKPVDEAVLTDETIPIALRKAVERVVYKNYVTMDGVRVRRDRGEFVRHIIRTRCRTLTKYDDFVIMYRNVVEDLGLAGEERLALEPRTYENRLNGSRFVLWNQWRRFRYYNIDAQDYAELFATLDMEQYRDTELSSLKVFRDYPELMEQYDIHDEYELHNLLKKIWPADAMPIRFPKMPTIEVGQVDRDAQVKALLFQCAPISGEAFAAKYEETYGIKASSAMANFFGCIEKYYYNGSYTVPDETLPADQTERMRRVLTEDFYSLRRARNLFLREFPDADAGRLTPYALKTIGFHVYVDYIIRDTYASAAEYFRSVLTSGDVLDMRGSGKELQRVVAYNSELYSLRAAYKIVEFSPLQYVSSKRLAEHGVTAQTLQAYCEDVAKRYEPGEYFTVASLRADGFMHPLDDLGFDEWFYGSVLLEARELFSYQRIGGTRLFMRGNAPVRIGGLLTELLEHEQKADIYELRDTLEEHFGIVLSKDKLIELVKETDLYYDAIMGAVYADYDTYFEEI